MSARDSLIASRRVDAPRTIVTLVVAIEHPEWVGDGDDEKIALVHLMNDIRHELRQVRVCEAETIPGTREGAAGCFAHGTLDCEDCFVDAAFEAGA